MCQPGTSGISSVHATQEASRDPGLVSAGEQAHCLLLSPTSSLSFTCDLQDGVRHGPTFTLSAPPGRGQMGRW